MKMDSRPKRQTHIPITSMPKRRGKFVTDRIRLFTAMQENADTKARRLSTIPEEHGESAEEATDPQPFTSASVVRSSCSTCDTTTPEAASHNEAAQPARSHHTSPYPFSGLVTPDKSPPETSQGDKNHSCPIRPRYSPASTSDARSSSPSDKVYQADSLDSLLSGIDLDDLDCTLSDIDFSESSVGSSLQIDFQRPGTSPGDHKPAKTEEKQDGDYNSSNFWDPRTYPKTNLNSNFSESSTKQICAKESNSVGLREATFDNLVKAFGRNQTGLGRHSSDDWPQGEEREFLDLEEGWHCAGQEETLQEMAVVKERCAESATVCEIQTECARAGEDEDCATKLTASPVAEAAIAPTQTQFASANSTNITTTSSVTAAKETPQGRRATHTDTSNSAKKTPATTDITDTHHGTGAALNHSTDAVPQAQTRRSITGRASPDTTTTTTITTATTTTAAAAATAVNERREGKQVGDKDARDKSSENEWTGTARCYSDPISSTREETDTPGGKRGVHTCAEHTQPTSQRSPTSTTTTTTRPASKHTGGKRVSSRDSTDTPSEQQRFPKVPVLVTADLGCNYLVRGPQVSAWPTWNPRQVGQELQQELARLHCQLQEARWLQVELERELEDCRRRGRGHQHRRRHSTHRCQTCLLQRQQVQRDREIHAIIHMERLRTAVSMVHISHDGRQTVITPTRIYSTAPIE